MANAKSSKNSADEIRAFLKEKFKILSPAELEKMKKLQEIVKKYPAKGGSLVDSLIEDRQREGL